MPHQKIAPELNKELKKLQRAINQAFGVRPNLYKVSKVYPRVKGKRGNSFFKELEKLLNGGLF